MMCLCLCLCLNHNFSDEMMFLSVRGSVLFLYFLLLYNVFLFIGILIIVLFFLFWCGIGMFATCHVTIKKSSLRYVFDLLSFYI